jgi:hypothetical protein
MARRCDVLGEYSEGTAEMAFVRRSFRIQF